MSRLHLDAQVDHTVSLVGLARSIRPDIAAGQYIVPIRKAAEFATRFTAADPETRHRMITAKPPATSDRRWDAFVAGLAEWLAVRAARPAPAWVRDENRCLRQGWWVTPMKPLRAWEYAGGPTSSGCCGRPAPSTGPSWRSTPAGWRRPTNRLTGPATAWS